MLSMSLLFCAVGIGYLFPFSALTQPVDYWEDLFPGSDIEFLITAVYMYSNLTCLSMLVFLRPSKPSGFRSRILFGFVGQLVVLAVVPSLTTFLHLSELSNRIIVLGGTALVAIATAFLDSALIALVSTYPAGTQQYFQLGVGVSTLIGSLYRDLTKAVFPVGAVVESSLLYFYVGALTIVLCILAFLQVPIFDSSEATEPLLNIDLGRDSSPESLEKIEFGNSSTKWTVLRKVIITELTVSLVFTCSLALWPPLVTQIPWQKQIPLADPSWWPLLLLTCFSVFDCLGRVLSGYKFGLTRHTLVFAVIARFIFFPIFILIALDKAPFLSYDGLVIVFVAILGFTNGHFATAAILFVNDCVEEHELPQAGSFTSFFLNLGLVLGASIGLILGGIVVK